MAAFAYQEVLPPSVLKKLTEARVEMGSQIVLEAAQTRVRRPRLTTDGRLNLLAVDHPARHVTRVGADPLRMTNRPELLGRIVRILLGNGVDGVMASQDILEDLFILDALLKEAKGPSLLDGRVVLGSLNRGGLAGAAWELDDPLTGATPAICRALYLDGAKMLLRVSLAERDSLRTLEACSRWITELNALGLPSFLEPLVADRVDGQWKMSKAPEALAQLVGVASALGDSSRLLWLKLPFTERFELVARATTLPILLLGGESQGDAAPLLREIEQGLAAGHNVRGVLVGRNVLYPGDQDPLVVSRAVNGVIHGGLSADAAGQALGEAAPELVSLERWIQ